MAKSKKRRRIIILVILLLILAIIAGFFILENYLENKIRDQLTTEAFPGHHVSVGKVELDLISGCLLLDSMNIHPNEEEVNRNNFLVHEAGIPFIKISGINFIKFLTADELHVHELDLQKPMLSLDILKPGPDSVKNAGKFPINQISLDNVSIEKMNFKLVSGAEARTIIAFDSLDFYASNFMVSLKDSVSFELPEVKKLGLRNFQSVVNDPFYDLYIGEINLHNDSNLVAKSVKLIPGFDKYTFSRKLGHQTDRADIRLDSLYMAGIHWNRFPDGIYHFRLISLNGLHAELLRDKRVPRPEGYFPPLPQQALRRMSQKLLIDSLQANNAEIHYYERVPGSNRPGHVFFEKLNVLVLNINSNPDHFGVRDLIRCYATGSLMGKSLARVRIWFPVMSANDTMFFKGNFENFRLHYLNAITTPNEQIRIDDGILNKLEFEASANKDFSKGELIFLYENLKVSVLKENKSLMKEQTLFSFLVNQMIRSNNPVGRRDPLIATMHFERDKEKSALNFLWKSVFSGVKETVTPGKKFLERGEEKDYFNK